MRPAVGIAQGDANSVATATVVGNERKTTMKTLMTAVSAIALIAGSAYGQSVGSPYAGVMIDQISSDVGDNTGKLPRMGGTNVADLQKPVTDTSFAADKTPNDPDKPGPVEVEKPAEVMDLDTQAFNEFNDAGLTDPDGADSDLEQTGDENTADVDQVGEAYSSIRQIGDDNIAAVDQNDPTDPVSGPGNNLAAIDTVGNDNLAVINQEWVASGGPNAAVIEQGNDSAGGFLVEANKNAAEINQEGAGNDATILQYDSFDQSSGVSADNTALIDQFGSDNIAKIQQDDRNMASVDQIGTSNEALIVQDDDNMSRVVQNGTDNKAANYQGDFQVSEIDQSGTNNQALVVQGTNGLGPTFGSPLGVGSDAQGNTSVVVQDNASGGSIGNMAEVVQGAYSDSSVMQMGDGNMAVVHQNVAFLPQ
jgi:hypothetical protein